MRQRVEKGLAVASSFYHFSARAPAYLEIRFNSLNFKKLPPLSRQSAPSPLSLTLPRVLLYLARSNVHVAPLASSLPNPWNRIATLCIVPDKVPRCVPCESSSPSKNTPSTTPSLDPWNTWGRLAHSLLVCTYAGPGLDVRKWQEYVVGILGKIVRGWPLLDEGRSGGNIVCGWKLHVTALPP